MAAGCALVNFTSSTKCDTESVYKNLFLGVLEEKRLLRFVMVSSLSKKNKNLNVCSLRHILSSLLPMKFAIEKW